MCYFQVSDCNVHAKQLYLSEDVWDPFLHSLPALEPEAACSSVLSSEFATYVVTADELQITDPAP